MRKKILLTMILMIMLTHLPAQQILYPETRKDDVKDDYFGTVVSDPYRWLEDDNSAETAAWVAAQNKITRAYLDAIPFRSALEKRLETIWNYPKSGVPFKKGGRWYIFKNDGLQNQSVLYTMNDPAEEPQLLLDPNNFSKDGTIALGSLSPSDDGKHLAYSISRGGSDWNEIVVMKLNDQSMLADTVKWVKFSGISWFRDGFFYSSYDAPDEGMALKGSNEFHKVYYHKLGTPQEADQLIFDDKKNPLRNFYAYLTDDKQFLMISESQATSGNALYVKNTADMASNFIKLAEGFDYEYSVVDHIDGKLIIVTNENAPLNKLMLVDPQNPDKANWETLIPEAPNVLQSVQLVGELIYAQYLEDAQSKVYFFDYNGNKKHELELPAPGTLSGFSGDKGENQAFFGFTSFTFPSSVYGYDLESHQLSVYSTSEVDFNPEDYVTQQLFFESKDGTKVPLFIVHHKSVQKTGDNPLLLYGYGGFNISLTPSFSVSRLPFLEQGGIFVMVNLRGGGEYGEDWHNAGTKFNKQNVFDDFIGAAEFLITEKYTNPQKIAIMGGSNGGLLVGACMTQRPELFRVAIPIVGVMDMLRYHLFTIGWAWAGDYGRSDDSPEMFEYLYSYSPLHNIKAGVEYPATLAITADHDDRVVPAHTFKFMAELQAKHKGNNPVLVRIETQAGHGAGKPTSKQIEESADMYGFIMYELGMKPDFE
ncbi:MAG: S9 family peptidase [Bacteroidales bacterium]|nr:S9 family peptidase [Bacteroidales bacterium]